MSQVGISEAARLVGRDRKSLYRDIKAGKLSATVDDSGEKRVDVTELIRVYGPLRPIGDSTPVAETVAAPLAETHALQVRVARLEAENEQLRERIVDKERNIDDMRNAMRLLEHRQTPAPAPDDSGLPWGWFWLIVAAVLAAAAGVLTILTR